MIIFECMQGGRMENQAVDLQKAQADAQVGNTRFHK